MTRLTLATVEAGPNNEFTLLASALLGGLVIVMAWETVRSSTPPGLAPPLTFGCWINSFRYKVILVVR